MSKAEYLRDDILFWSTSHMQKARVRHVRADLDAGSFLAVRRSELNSHSVNQ